MSKLCPDVPRLHNLLPYYAMHGLQIVHCTTTTSYNVHPGFYFPHMFRLYTRSVAFLYDSNCSVYLLVLIAFLCSDCTLALLPSCTTQTVVYTGTHCLPVFKLYTSSVAFLYNSDCSVPSCNQTLLIDSNCILALTTVLYPQCSQCLTDCLCSDSMLALTFSFTLCTQTIHWFILPSCTQTVYYASTHCHPIFKLYWHSLPSFTQAVY